MKIKAGGSATELDVAVVTEKMGLLDDAVLASLADRKIDLVVCRDNVTDYRPELADKQPRNWPEGKTWKIVPGCYMPATKEVVIATLGEGDQRRVPAKGEKHGSFDLVVHEVMHADDLILKNNEWRNRSDNAGFLKAWRDDITDGGFANYAYEAKEAEEGYAESAARFFASDTRLADEWPNLFEFWKNGVLPIEVGEAPPQRRGGHAHGDTVGTARRTAEGAVELDLIATSDDGVIGHALFTLEPDEPQFASVEQQLGPRRRGDTGPGEPVLLRPF